jgi:hypothetical protein
MVSVVLVLQCLTLVPRPSYVYAVTQNTNTPLPSICDTTYEHFPLYPAYPVISMSGLDRTVK